MPDADQINKLLNQYEIAKPKVYRTTSSSPSTVPLESPLDEVLSFAPKQVSPPPSIPKHAVWIVHGMGQQIPFETVDSLTVGLRGVIPAGTGTPRLRAVKFGDQVVQRVELVVQETSGRTCEIHLYEAYWAPVTEGVAKITDVLSFFWDGGSRGILNAFRSFQRAMFSGVMDFTIHKRAIAEICATLITLLALIAINAVVLAAGSSKTQIPILGGLKIGSNWTEITSLASAMCCVAISFGVILFLAETSKPASLSRWLRYLLSFAGWVGLACTGIAIVVSAALMLAVTWVPWVISLMHSFDVAIVQGLSTLLILLAGVLVGFAMFARAILRSLGSKQRGNTFLVFLFALSFFLQLAALVVPWIFGLGCFPLPSWLSAPVNFFHDPFWVWPLLIILSANVRSLMVEYAGDVAVYVSPNKLDRFDQVRKEIKKIALDSITGIYQARDEGDETRFEYDRIAIVGHSLGSVIAYDTLNKLLTDDNLTGSPLNVAGRTCLFETFGSPLDKIAFFFTIQGKNTFHIREQLTDLVQPLIQDPDYRQFPWVNVYSKNDIICGDLFLFDPPPAIVEKMNAKGQSWKLVQNIPDPDAVVPLVAHVDYWKNTLVWDVLFAAVRPSPTIGPGLGPFIPPPA